MQDGWEILTDWTRMNPGAENMVRAMVAAAPLGTLCSPSYTGGRRGLMMYGPGHPARLPLIERHRKRGGVVAAWDLGYWKHEMRGMRLSINGLHPTIAQMDLAPTGASRVEVALREDSDPKGPILLIGNGRKSISAYGLGGWLAWEQHKLRDLQKRFPRNKIIWRPKGKRAASLPGVLPRHDMPIEEALHGCSLVVSHHSNVSVDAAIAGVPFEAEQGAALWLAKRGFTPENRLEFLQRLSWWNYTHDEAPQAWDWIRRIT